MSSHQTRPVRPTSWQAGAFVSLRRIAKRWECFTTRHSTLSIRTPMNTPEGIMRLLKPLAPMRRRANDHVRALAMTSSRIWMPFIDFNTILTFPQVGKETRVVLEVDIGPRFEFIACLFAVTTRSPPGCPLDITPRVRLGYASGRSFLLILIPTVPFAP
jgi:hypothetical protein